MRYFYINVSVNYDISELNHQTIPDSSAENLGQYPNSEVNSLEVIW